MKKIIKNKKVINKKERENKGREQPNPETNPPRITSAKNYTKKKKEKKDSQNPRTNGKSKAIQTKITQRSIHIHTKREKRKKYIYKIKKGREQPNQ